MPRLSIPLEYEFHAPTKIVFGWGKRKLLGELAKTVGNRAWLVWGSRTIQHSSLGEEMLAALADAGLQPRELAAVSAEPTVAAVDAAAEWLRAGLTNGDFLIAIGGGSAIDLAKGVAGTAIFPANVSVQEFLEGLGTGRTIEAALPILAVPTTGGTGSEATKNGVITCISPAAKKSLRGEAIFPRIALVDPQLAESLPKGVTVSTGMDALTQLIESYISSRARPIARSLALQGIPEVVAALGEVAQDRCTRSVRESLAHGALLSGMALANSGLGMAHGVAAGLGALHQISHGLACAMMLPCALKVNRPVCTRAYTELACALDLSGHTAEALADSFVDKIETLARELGVPTRLRDIGISADDLPAIVAASQGNSMRGNPRAIPPDELARLLSEML